MRRYETIFITHPDLSEEDLEALTQRTTGIIRERQGEVIQVQQWGRRKLAYRVNKQLRGYYTLLDYASLPAAVGELERILRLDDRVMKYLTVKLDDKVDLEAIQRAVAEEQQRTETAEEGEASETPQEEGETESEGQESEGQESEGQESEGQESEQAPSLESAQEETALEKTSQED